MIRSMILACTICALGVVGCVPTSSASDETSVAQNTNSCILWDCRNIAGLFGFVQCVAIPLCFAEIDIRIGGGCPQCRVLNDFELDVLIEDLDNSTPEDINILNFSQVVNTVEQTVVDTYRNEFDISVTKNNISTCTPALGICL